MVQEGEARLREGPENFEWPDSLSEGEIVILTPAMAQKVDDVIIVTNNSFSAVLRLFTFSAGNKLNVHAAVSQPFPPFVDFTRTASD
jgi:hypothetical protein